ncbi:MAG: ral nucleoside transport system ATP-binding protein [Actinomycetota bacterium]|nr:ral nucleoside transport system ATP-binding protein [Actinomycetota bacterium]
MVSIDSEREVSAADQPVIELRAITKRFPGVVANSNVNLAVGRGQIHAIVGENGAGKSTLMKTLYGMHHPDEGTILVDGKPAAFKSPTDAIAAGIGMVHQHFMLADNFTVLENIILGSEPTSGGRLDIDAARARIIEISDGYGLGLQPDRLVEHLSVAQRQRVEIAKVLYRGARVLILDEPTAVLVPQEVDELFDNLNGLRAEGLSVIFISHKLDEVLKVADIITVIRRGTTVGTVEPKSVNARQLAEMMVGSELPVPETRESTVTDHVQLAVTGVSAKGSEGTMVLDDITFSLHRGEVVGFAGVEGNGQSELVETLLGLIKPVSGSILLDGEDITTLPTLNRRERGIAFVPEDRHRQALMLQAPLWENRVLGHQWSKQLFRRGLLRRKAAIKDTARIMREYDVRAPGTDTIAGALSGGNQQKLIIGRELEGNPNVLIAAHPTRGVDVGAQAAIWDRIRGARSRGLATLLISADLEELIGLSDTLYVILRGRLVARLDPGSVTPKDLGSYMTGAVSADAATQDAPGNKAAGKEGPGKEDSGKESPAKEAEA